MKYRINIPPEAFDQIEEAYLWIRRDSPRRAVRWREKLHAKINTLTLNPQRCPLASESESLGAELRELLFGNRRSAY